AVARPGIERDVGNVERAQRLRRHVAAETGCVRARRHRPLDRGERIVCRCSCRGRACGSLSATRHAAIPSAVDGTLYIEVAPRPVLTAPASSALAQPRQYLEAGISIGRREPGLTLERAHGHHGVVSDAAVVTVGIEAEGGEAALDFLHFSKRRRAFATRELL